jgi:ankyrin repeat protein
MEAIAASGRMDLFTALTLRDWDAAEELLHVGDNESGVLHLLAKRGDADAVKWLLDHSVDSNARWAHWDSDVTPLHLAVLGGHTDIVRLLLEAGADPHIRDSKHDSDAIGWAEFFEKPEIVRMLELHTPRS